MATVDPKTNTAYATTDWTHYSTGRPPYPASLTDLIYAYRNTSADPASWNRLVDVGAGNGVASINFIRDFAIIHNSDPSPTNEASARAFLTSYASEHSLNPILEFSQAVGEDAWKPVVEGQADLAICATAAHFIDGDGLAESIAKMLKPGGTLAVYSYWMPKFPNSSAHLNSLFEQTFDKVALTPLWNAADSPQKAKLAKVIERRFTGRGPMDSVPLPSSLFTRRQRVYINGGKDSIPFSDVYARLRPSDGTPYGVSRVEDGESLVFFESGADVQAEGWEFDVDKAFVRNFFDTIRPKEGREGEEKLEALRRWEEAFDEESVEGKVRISWPCYIALATRR